jgi:hypothetical protein
MKVGMFKEKTSATNKKASARRKIDVPQVIKVLHLEDGRPVPVQPGGLVDVAVHELDAQIVEVALIESDDSERPFSSN